MCRAIQVGPNPENALCGHGRLMWLGVVMAFRKEAPDQLGGIWGDGDRGPRLFPKSRTFVENLSKPT
jgi:hypothetical protein